MSNNIDKIIYINLDKRTDRRDEIEKELNNFNLSYERYPAIYKTGAVGCAQSHLNVLKLAKERGYKNVLILEDDFTFLVSKEEFESNLKSFFEKFPNYDVCMLSYRLHKFEEIKEECVNRLLFSQTASGYLVNSNYYDKLIDLYEKAIPLLEKTGEHWNYANDIVWKDLQKTDKWYYFKTRIGKQRAGYSDHANKVVDFGC